MSLRIEITLEDNATPEIREMLRRIRPGGGLGMAMGRGLGGVLKAHFRARNVDSPNRLGGKRTNFWSRVAQGVQQPVVDAGGVSVTVSHPAILQKFRGGTITAKPGKALAIPVHPAAHGKSPRVFDNLSLLIVGPKKTALLARKERGKGRFTTFYVLKKQVTQAADPRTLPGEAAMLEGAAAAGRAFLNKPGGLA
jgi:hypothetical protein